MNRLVDPVLGAALNGLGDVMTSSWGLYRLLFSPLLTPSMRLAIGRRRSAAAFLRASARVPGYRAFLDKHGARDVRRFEDIPVMDKESYVKAYPLEETLVDGRMPRRGAVIDESSGSSGTASNWVRGPGERAALKRLIRYSARATFGDAPYVLLNAFALGPWATGMNVSMALVDECVMKSIGPDARKVLATLELLGPKYRYVITGYPPFLKTLVDSASLDWSRYEIVAVVGGEGMSEPLRAALNRAFRKTFSSFGASDLEINLASETDFTIALRQALVEDSSLAHELYGSEGLPMIFQFDPLNYTIESDAERNLLFTLNRLENASPRVRYNLHDRGIVLPMSRVRDVLRARGRTLRPQVNLPLLFHWGRQGLAATFYGCKVTPEDVQHTLLRVPGLAERVESFALHPFEDERANKRLDIYLERKSGAALDASALTTDFLRELGAVNQDFRESIRMVPEALRPTLVVFPFGESPMSGQDVRVKRRYIV